MKVVVIGAGVMGPGIAQTFLMGGHDAVLVDVFQEALDRGKEEIEKCLRLMEDEGIVENANDLLAHLSLSTKVEDVAGDADLVVEAVPERPDIKMEVYEQLDPLCKPDAVIVSNTSSFPVSDLIPEYRPGNFFVCHFFNPPAINPFVEIAHGANTNPEKVQWLRDILEGCGKKPVVLNKYISGFLLNRLQTALMREALYLLEEGVVSADDLNRATQIGIGFKTAWQGIFETMDFIGLDTVAYVEQNLMPDLYTGTEGSNIIAQKIAVGKLGLKTGEGFYNYEGKQQETQDKRFMEMVDQLKLYKKYHV